MRRISEARGGGMGENFLVFQCWEKFQSKENRTEVVKGKTRKFRSSEVVSHYFQ